MIQYRNNHREVILHLRSWQGLCSYCYIRRTLVSTASLSDGSEDKNAVDESLDDRAEENVEDAADVRGKTL